MEEGDWICIYAGPKGTVRVLENILLFVKLKQKANIGSVIAALCFQHCAVKMQSLPQIFPDLKMTHPLVEASVDNKIYLDCVIKKI